jgi:hypothetical protein
MSAPVTHDDIVAGQAAFTRSLLAVYDLLVLGFSCRCVWRCPKRVILDLYNQHVSASHLDVGVGTGYFLDRCRFPTDRPRIALADLNLNCLEVAARRIARYRPEMFVHNILEPIVLDGRTVDSVGLNFVLHCVPGTIESKSIAFDHLRALVNPGGVIFGSTLLWDGVPRNLLARTLMPLYNRKRIFSNRCDSLEGLRQALASRFATYELRTVGCAALFVARV